MAKIIDKIFLKDNSGVEQEYPLGADSSNVTYSEGVSIRTKVDTVGVSIDNHKNAGISNQAGIHGFRYYQQQLQVHNNTTDEWETVTVTTETDVKVGDVVGPTLTADNTKISLSWTDPADNPQAIWFGTKVVRKQDSAPTDPTDGVVVVNSTIRDEFSSTPFVDTTAQTGKIYYYRFFPYKVVEGRNVYTNGTALSGSIVLGVIEHVPSPVTSHYEYDGTVKTPEQNYYDETMMTRTGELSGSEAKVYVVNFTPKVGYTWSDGGREEKTVNWSIGVQPLAIPTLYGDGEIVYPDKIQGTSDLYGFDSNTMRIVSGSENIGSLKEPGQYSFTLGIIDKINYAQTDGTTEDKTYQQNVIPRAILNLPTVQGTEQVYDGDSHSPMILSFGITFMVRLDEVTIRTTDWTDVTGGDSQTEAGDYLINFALKSKTQGYIQDDNTLNDKAVAWHIFKAENPSGVSSNSVTLDEEHTNVRVNLTDLQGTCNIYSNNPDIATVDYTPGKQFFNIKQNGPDYVKGSTVVFVNIAGGNNYKDKQIIVNVTADFNGLGLQATSPDTLISSMINRYYTGELSLSDIESVQSVGDVRQANTTNHAKFKVASHTAPMVFTGTEIETNVTIPEMTTVKQVILDFNHDRLKDPVRLGSVVLETSLVTIQMVGTISNSSTPTVQGQGNMPLKQSTNNLNDDYLNTIFYNVCGFKNLIREVMNDFQDGTSVVTVNNKIFLASTTEIMGTPGGGFEGTTYDYFNTESNVPKKEGWEGLGNYAQYQTRTRSSSDVNNYGAVIHSDPLREDSVLLTNSNSISPICAL